MAEPNNVQVIAYEKAPAAFAAFHGLELDPHARRTDAHGLRRLLRRHLEVEAEPRRALG